VGARSIVGEEAIIVLVYHVDDKRHLALLAAVVLVI
jgi:hypothetical protein